MTNSVALEPPTIAGFPAPHSTTDANPFEGWLELAKNTIVPQFPPWALNLLIASAVWRVLIMIACLVMLMTPAFRGAASRKKHYFFIRRVFPGPRRKPFLVPNRSMVITLCELVSSAIYLASALLNYRFYSGTTLAQGTNIVVWYGLSWLPSYLGIWMAGWALTHACLYDMDDTAKNTPSRLLTPLVYNSLWISWTLIVTIMTFMWAIYTAQVQSILESNYLYLFSLLQHAANSWNEYHDFSKIPLEAIFNSLNLTKKATNQLSSIIQRWAFTWLVLAIGLAIFYFLAVRYLLRMLNQVLLLGDADGMARGELSGEIWLELEEEFRYLFRSCVLISLAICCQICLVIYQSLSGTHLEFLKWRIGSALLTQLPGVFMEPCLLYQAWRIITERQFADESDFHQARTGFNDSKVIPEMTSQLLGWDTTICWSRRSDIEIANFPGLRQLQPNNSMEARRSRDSQRLASSRLGIKVMRLTVVTEDIETT